MRDVNSDHTKYVVEFCTLGIMHKWTPTMFCLRGISPNDKMWSTSINMLGVVMKADFDESVLYVCEAGKPGSFSTGNIVSILWAAWKRHLASLNASTCIHTATETHCGWNKMATIFQTKFSNAFSWMKMYKFRLRFYWILFTRVQSTIFQH